MVKRIFKVLNQEIGGLHEAAYLLAFFALLAQILALFRDRLFALYFGPSNILDVYYAGFRIPDFIFTLFTSIVSISVLVPFLTERLNKSREDGVKFINNIFSLFFLLIIVVSVVVFFLLPYFSAALFPGFTPEQVSQVIMVSRILLLSPILLGVSNFLASITQVFKRFVIYSISPILYNVGIIAGIYFFYPLWGVAGLAVGVAFGALMHLAIQIPFVLKTGLMPRIQFFSWEIVKDAVLISVPRALSISASQLAIFAMVSIASVLGVGAISIFNFSYNLQSVPLSIIGVSYSIAAFPVMARLFSEGKKEKFLEEIIASAKHIIFWSLPVLVLFIVLRAQIVRVIYGSGHFNWTDTRLTAAALALFMISILAQSLNLLLLRAYYAMGNTKYPFWCNVGSAILAVVLGLGFLKLSSVAPVFKYFLDSILRVEDLPVTALLTLPLGFSLATIAGTWFMMIGLNRRFPGFIKSLFPSFFQGFSAAIIGGFAAYLGLNFLNGLVNLNTFMGIFLQGFGAGILGIITSFVILLALGSEELNETWKTFHRKIWKAKPLPSEIREL